MPIGPLLFSFIFIITERPSIESARNLPKTVLLLLLLVTVVPAPSFVSRCHLHGFTPHPRRCPRLPGLGPQGEDTVKHQTIVHVSASFTSRVVSPWGSTSSSPSPMPAPRGRSRPPAPMQSPSTTTATMPTRGIRRFHLLSTSTASSSLPRFPTQPYPTASMWTSDGLDDLGEGKNHSVVLRPPRAPPWHGGLAMHD